MRACVRVQGEGSRPPSLGSSALGGDNEKSPPLRHASRYQKNQRHRTPALFGFSGRELRDWRANRACRVGAPQAGRMGQRSHPRGSDGLRLPRRPPRASAHHQALHAINRELRRRTRCLHLPQPRFRYAANEHRAFLHASLWEVPLEGSGSRTSFPSKFEDQLPVEDTPYACPTKGGKVLLFIINANT